MKSLVIVGACYLDTILTVDHYPSEDEKLRASSILKRRGGNGPNTAEVLQQLLAYSAESRKEKAKLHLLVVLPARLSNGVKLIKSSLGPHVDLTHSIYRETYTEPASSYIITNQSSGSRTIVNYNGLSEMTTDEFIGIADSVGPTAGWFHFEGRIPTTTLECMRYLRKNFPAIRISIEAEKPDREGLQELAAEADVVFYSKTWAQGRGYCSKEECLTMQAKLTPKASILCCTWGEDGAAILDIPNNDYVTLPSFTGTNFQVLDTVGAGDTFIAGILYGFINHETDWDLSQRVEFANKLAGLKVAQEGFSGLANAMIDHL